MTRLVQLVFGVVAVCISAVSAVSAVGVIRNQQVGLAIFWGFLAIVFGVVGRKWLRGKPKSWRDDPATDKQKSFAEELGIKYRKGMTKGELSDLISAATGSDDDDDDHDDDDDEY